MQNLLSQRLPARPRAKGAVLSIRAPAHVTELLMVHGRVYEAHLTLQRRLGSSDWAACADEVFQVTITGGLTAWTQNRSVRWGTG